MREAKLCHSFTLMFFSICSFKFIMVSIVSYKNFKIKYIKFCSRQNIEFMCRENINRTREFNISFNEFYL